MPKTFPIKTATACQLKWTWSTLFLTNGTTSSCHRVGKHPLLLDDFDSFHNTPEKISQRKTMLKGEWPQPLPYMTEDEGCRYCQKIEEVGGQSDRMFHSQIPDLSPKELDTDPTATRVTPKIIEVYLNNTCNLSCTYCDANISSRIEFENKKFGPFEKNGFSLMPIQVDRVQTQQYIEKFFLWLEKNSSELKRLHLLGGEPLYQKEFYRCMDILTATPNKDLELNLVTNLMISTENLEKNINQWKSMLLNRRIKRIDITVSLDCWGPEQEYARYGLKLDLIERNMQALINNPWICLNINSTLSPLTIKTFSDLIDRINQWKTQGKINHYFGSVFMPQHHNPGIFGSGFWEKDLNLALERMPDTTWQEKNARNYLSGIASQIQNSCKNPEMILQLHTHLDELDRRRGTNWRQLFPYLETEI